MSKSISTVVLLFVGLIALTGAQDNNQSATQSMPQIGYKFAAGAEQKKDAAAERLQAGFHAPCERASRRPSEVLRNRRAQSRN